MAVHDQRVLQRLAEGPALPVAHVGRTQVGDGLVAVDGNRGAEQREEVAWELLVVGDQPVVEEVARRERRQGSLGPVVG
jgi:hypothetical protein